MVKKIQREVQSCVKVLLIVPLEETKRWNEEGSCVDRSNEDITGTNFTSVELI
jgi:hypothetical protein